MNGNSNYAFPLILKKSMKQRDNLEKLMTKKIEFDEETLGWKSIKTTISKKISKKI